VVKNSHQARSMELKLRMKEENLEEHLVAEKMEALALVFRPDAEQLHYCPC